MSLRDAAHVEQVLQFRVQIVEIKTCVWIPAHVTDVLEVAGSADVGFGQLLLLAFGLLVLSGQAAMAQHVVDVIRLLLVAVGVVEADIVDLRVLDVHRGHVWQSWTIFRVTSFVGFTLPSVEQVVDGDSESFGFFLAGKVQTDLTGISCKRDEVGSGAADGEVVVQFLFKHGFPFLDVKHSDEVGPLWVVFDQTGDSTASLHPAAAPLGHVDLDHRRTQSGAFPAQVTEQAFVLLRGQEDGADVSSPAGRRVAVHGSKFF